MGMVGKGVQVGKPGDVLWYGLWGGTGDRVLA